MSASGRYSGNRSCNAPAPGCRANRTASGSGTPGLFNSARRSFSAADRGPAPDHARSRADAAASSVRSSLRVSRACSAPFTCSARNRLRVAFGSPCRAAANCSKVSTGIAHGQPGACTKRGVVATSDRPLTRSGAVSAARSAICPPRDQPSQCAQAGATARHSSAHSDRSAADAGALSPCPGNSMTVSRNRSDSPGNSGPQTAAFMPQPCSRTRSGP